MIAAPCVFPGCRQPDGGVGAVLTSMTVCEDCRHKLRRLLDDLVLDYARLKRYFPKPVRTGSGGGGGGQKSFGHPAEWASATAQDLAADLNTVHDDLAEQLGALPAPHPGIDEALRVNAAHRFFVANFNSLCLAELLPGQAVLWQEAHTSIRRALGQTVMVRRLAAPCPNCGVAALVEIPPPRPRRHGPRLDAFIQCRECRAEFDADAYDGYTKEAVEIVKAEHTVLIDAAVYIYDTPRRALAEAMTALWFRRVGL